MAIFTRTGSELPRLPFGAGRSTGPWPAAATLLGYGLVSAVELLAVSVDSRALEWAVKPLLMPLLIAYLVVARRTDLRALLAGLCFAAAGDVALLVPGQTAFLVGMGCFLGAQLNYLVAFLRSGPSRRGRPPWAAVAGYGLFWAGANLTLWSRLGPLRLPVLGYSLALTAMAAAATGVSRRVAVGAALFVLSDLLIGVGAALGRLPGHDLAVMSTYTVGQALIVTGLVAAVRPVTPARPVAAGRPGPR